MAMCRKKTFVKLQSLFFENKLFSNWVAVNIMKHLCQVEDFLKRCNVLNCNSLPFQIHNSSIGLFMYLITSYILQKIFLTLEFELVPQLLSPVSGPVLLLNF